jgi:hypothetical protein
MSVTTSSCPSCYDIYAFICGQGSEENYRCNGQYGDNTFSGRMTTRNLSRQIAAGAQDVVKRGAVLGWLEDHEGREFEMFITGEITP